MLAIAANMDPYTFRLQNMNTGAAVGPPRKLMTCPTGDVHGATGNGNGNGAQGRAPGPWTPAHSSKLYGISNWGQGYFSVNDQGHVAVHPHRNGKQIDLKKLVDELRERDIQLPCLIRFTDILKHRVGQIHADADGQ